MKENQDIFERRESAVRSYCRSFPTVFASGRGSVITDQQGRNYLDFFSGAGTLNYGHNDPDMVAALQAYLGRNGIVHTLDMFSEAKAGFIAAFERHILVPRGLDHKIQFTGPTGADAVEAALKLARKVTGRATVACFSGGYHGMSAGALALTANAGKRAASGVLMPGVLRLPYDGFLPLSVADQLAVLEAQFTRPGSGIDAPAAFVLECVQGEGGLNAASATWAQGLAALARRIGALLVIDDIQAGCGRTGPFFSFEPLSIVPDIVCLSKALGGIGLPFSANLIAPHCDLWSPGEHVGTFRGNNLAMVAATVALDKFWADSALSERVAQRHADAVALLDGAFARIATGQCELLGRGLMLGVRFAQPQLAVEASRALFGRGLIAETCGPRQEVLKLMPALTIDASAFHDGLAQVAEVCAGLTAHANVQKHS